MIRVQVDSAFKLCHRFVVSARMKKYQAINALQIDSNRIGKCRFASERDALIGAGLLR
jgi:hypothetical protein